MPEAKKYLSKIVKSGNTLHLKDAEARQEIEDIKSSITGAMHWAGFTTSALTDGATTNPIVIEGENYTAKAGDVVCITGDGTYEDEQEFVFNGTKWQKYGPAGSFKALAFKDNASTDYTPAGTNAASAVSFAGQTDGDFVTGFNDDAVAPSFQEGAFSQGSLPSFEEGAFTPAAIQAGFVTAGSAATFSEGAFTPAEYGTDTFDGGSLGNATKSSFATAGETSVYDEDSETLTFSDATTAQAVTEQGTFTPATYSHSGFSGGSKAADTFDGGTPTAIDTTKFSGGSKAADTFNAGALPTKAADTFNAGSAATPTTAKAITAVGTGTAAAQVFSGTQDTITVS